MEKNIFEKIRDNESPCELVYKDTYVTAFNDIHPDAPAHILIIPNKKIASLNDILEEDSDYLSNILLVAKKIAKELGIIIKIILFWQKEIKNIIFLKDL